MFDVKNSSGDTLLPVDKTFTKLNNLIESGEVVALRYSVVTRSAEMISDLGLEPIEDLVRFVKDKEDAGRLFVNIFLKIALDLVHLNPEECIIAMEGLLKGPIGEGLKQEVRARCRIRDLGIQSLYSEHSNVDQKSH